MGYNGSTADNFEATDSADLIFGNNGNDSIAGKDGSDYIYGGAGEDTIAGGKGTNTLYGGDGYDTDGQVNRFIVGEGTDIIRDVQSNDAVFIRGSLIGIPAQDDGTEVLFRLRGGVSDYEANVETAPTSFGFRNYNRSGAHTDLRCDPNIGWSR